VFEVVNFNVSRSDKFTETCRPTLFFAHLNRIEGNEMQCKWWVSVEDFDQPETLDSTAYGSPATTTTAITT